MIESVQRARGNMAHAAQPCPKGVGGSQVENIDRRMKISWCCSGLLFRELKRSLLCLTGTIKPFQMLTPTKARVSDAKDFNKAPSTKCVLAAAGDGPGSVPAAPKAMQPGGGDHESSKKKGLLRPPDDMVSLSTDVQMERGLSATGLAERFTSSVQEPKQCTCTRICVW